MVDAKGYYIDCGQNRLRNALEVTFRMFIIREHKIAKIINKMGASFTMMMPFWIWHTQIKKKSGLLHE